MTDPRHDPIAYLKRTRRPRLLMEAARLGLPGYERARGLPPLLGAARLPPPGAAFVPLAECEQRHEFRRRTPGEPYSPRAHVETMTALLAEARLGGLRP